jgi:tetratricopeptide (TPR) repeat protein
LKFSQLQVELKDARDQLEKMHKADVARLKKAGDWSKAANSYEALIAVKETQLLQPDSLLDDEYRNRASSDITIYIRELGAVYLNAAALAKVGSKTRKSYLTKAQGRTRDAFNGIRTESRSDDQFVRECQLQLAKILRTTGETKERTEAERIYSLNWIVDKHDAFSLECGHELGCLYFEQGRLKKAEDQLREVLDLRKLDEPDSEQLLETATQLLFVIPLKKTEERLPILEDLWHQQIRPLSGAMLRHAEGLATLYRTKKMYEEAIPVYKELWSTQNTCPPDCQLQQRKFCDACTNSGDWFSTGYRYGDVLTKMNDDSQYRTASTVLAALWAARAVSSTRTISNNSIAISYLHALIYLGEIKLAEEVGASAWDDAQKKQNWKTDISALSAGYCYGDALNRNGKHRDASSIYEEVYGARKALMVADDKQSLKRVLKVGRPLLAIISEPGFVGGEGQIKRKKLEAEIKKLDADVKKLK